MRFLTQFKHAFLLVFATVFWGANAAAQGTGTKEDPYIMVDGGEYAFKVYKDFYGQFIVPEDVTTDGVVLELVADNWTDIYADKDLTQLISTTTGNFAPYTSTVDVAKGTPKGTIYYIYSDFPMNSGSVKVSYGGGSALELTRVTPAEGSVLSAGESYVGLEFSKPIRFSSCTLYAGSVQKEIEANQIDRFVSIEPKSELMECYNSGNLKQGDDILFVLSNVTSYDGKSNIGNVVIRYKAAPKPIMLVSSVNTPESGMPKIKSWMPTTSEEGLVQLVFNGKLNKEATISAILSFGNSETEDPGEYYTETLTPTFTDDNTIQLDLRGKLRLPSEMVTSGTNYESMLLTIRGIEDEHGYKSFVDGSGSSGAYFIDYGFELINYSVMTDFMPAAGQSIDNYNEITIWMQELGGNLTYSGAVYEYIYGGEQQQVEVAFQDIKKEVDEEDNTAHYLTIPVPDFSRDANTQVTFRLKDVEFPDGMSHTSHTAATYTTAGHTSVTGINTLQQSTAKRIYTIDGKLVKSPTKSNGVFIINGKKTLVK